MGEERYKSLKIKFPERAEKLFDEAEKQAKDNYNRLINEKKAYDEMM